MQRFKEAYDDKNRDLSEKFRLAHLIRTEITTRLIYKRNTPINIAEFLNICFPLIEGVRSAIRLVQCPNVASSELALAAEYALLNTLELLDKWHYPYTTWIRSASASNNQIKKILGECQDHSYESVQTFCPSSGAIIDDIITLLALYEELASAATRDIEGVQTAVPDQRKSGWLSLFRSKK
jgi:hypothetical protein